jgi:hypothetical protein
MSSPDVVYTLHDLDDPCVADELISIYKVCYSCEKKKCSCCQFFPRIVTLCNIVKESSDVTVH